MITRTEQIASSVFILLASGAGFFYSYSKIEETNMALHPFFFPAIVMGLIFVLGLCRLVIGVRMARTGEKGTTLQFPAKSLLTIGLIAAYAFSFKSLGFVLSTFAYLILQMAVLWEGKKKPWLILLVAVAGSLGVYLVFVHLFHVMLPTGLLDSILN